MVKSCCVCGKDSTMEVKQGKEKLYFCAWMCLAKEAEAVVNAVYSTPGGYYPQLPSEKRELDMV